MSGGLEGSPKSLQPSFFGVGSGSNGVIDFLFQSAPRKNFELVPLLKGNIEDKQKLVLLLKKEKERKGKLAAATSSAQGKNQSEVDRQQCVCPASPARRKK